MERAHLHLPITRPNGDLLLFADVTLLDHSTGQPVYPAAWDGAGEMAQPVAWPITFAPGVVDLWLSEPGRYDLRVIGDSGYATTIRGVDVLPSPGNQVRIPDSKQQVTTAGMPRRWLKSSAGSLRFVDPGLIAAHNHDGAGANSTLIGLLDSNTTADVLGKGVRTDANSARVGFGSTAPTGGVTLGDHNGTGAAAQQVTLPLDSTGAASGFVNDTVTALRSLRVQGTAIGFDGEVLTQGLSAQGDVVVAGASGTVGFFESEGAAKGTVPAGSTGVVASLVAALQAYGLISQV